MKWSVVLFILCVIIGMLNLQDLSADPKLSSLFSYSGYISVPSAYITDGQISFDYSFIPKEIAPFHNTISNNRIFSSRLGLLPFLECYISLYVAPSTKWLYNYGPEKTRSAGFKMRLLRERKYVPAFSIGIFDPDIQKVGADFSWSNISSYFGVMSKRFNNKKCSVSLGYGLEKLSSENARLIGLFGGFHYNFWKNISLVSDYDSENWNNGIGAHIYGFTAVIALMDNSFPAYRIGYTLNLLKR